MRPARRLNVRLPDGSTSGRPPKPSTESRTSSGRTAARARPARCIAARA